MDDLGLRVDLLAAAGVDAVILTPAHQHPTGVVLARHRAVHVTPTVAKAAAGAIEHLPMAVVGGKAGGGGGAVVVGAGAAVVGAAGGAVVGAGGGVVAVAGTVEAEITTDVACWAAGRSAVTTSLATA